MTTPPPRIGRVAGRTLPHASPDPVIEPTPPPRGRKRGPPGKRKAKPKAAEPLPMARPGLINR